MIHIRSQGTFRKTTDALKRMMNLHMSTDFDRYGQIGVDALARATPVDTGLTADSWYYNITKDPPGIIWSNSNTTAGTSVAILIQYGHGTGTGGYVIGRDFINPAIIPVFDRIADEIWKEVNR